MIRKLELTDVDACAQIMQDEYQGLYNEFLKGTYPQEALEFDLSHCTPQHLSRYKREGLIGYVAERDGRVVGMILGEVFGKSGVSRIAFLGVKREERGQGLGDELLTALEEKCRKWNCHKLTVNTFPQLPNVDFYRTHGYFEEIVLKKHYWRMDVAVLSKYLDGTAPAEPQEASKEFGMPWGGSEESDEIELVETKEPEPEAEEAPEPVLGHGAEAESAPDAGPGSLDGPEEPEPGSESPEESREDIEFGDVWQKQVDEPEEDEPEAEKPEAAEEAPEPALGESEGQEDAEQVDTWSLDSIVSRHEKKRGQIDF